MSARFVLFLHLDRFYIRALELEEASPTVVHKDKLVLDANQAARVRSVTVGMALQEAKTLLGKDGTFFEWQEEAYTETQQTWLDVCTIFSDVIEPTNQHQAFLDLSEHPQPEDIRRQLELELAYLGYAVQSGASSSKWIAKAAALTAPSPVATLNPKAYVATLPVHCLPIEPEWSSRLNLLGCRSIADVQQMRIEALTRQFGKAAYDIRRFAEGEGPAEVEKAYPAGSVADRFRFDGGTDDLQSFDNGLKSLAQKVGVGLAQQDLGSEQLEVWLEGEEGESTHLSRKFSKAIGSPASLLVSLRNLCGSPTKPVSQIRIRLSNLKKGRRVQKTLDNLTSLGAKPAASASAVAQVRAAFGENSIQLGSEVQQPRWKQVRSVWRSANGWTFR